MTQANKLLLLVFLVFAIACSQTQAQVQGYEVSIGSGVGSFSMNDLKEFDAAFMAEVSIIDLKTTESFPPFFTFTAKGGVIIKNKIVGLFLGYQSTGSRTTYNDRSGSLTLDQLVEAFTFGSYAHIPIGSINRIPGYLFLEPQASYILSTGTINQRLIIGNSKSGDDINITSDGLAVAANLGYNFSVSRLNIRPSIGYLLNPLNKGFHLKENAEAKLMNGNNEVKPDWSGWRTGLELSLSL